jgi:hypothetical protein
MSWTVCAKRDWLFLVRHDDDETTSISASLPAYRNLFDLTGKTDQRQWSHQGYGVGLGYWVIEQDVCPTDWVKPRNANVWGRPRLRRARR